jgi:hypothetical protein
VGERHDAAFEDFDRAVIIYERLVKEGGREFEGRLIDIRGRRDAVRDALNRSGSRKPQDSPPAPREKGQRRSR